MNWEGSHDATCPNSSRIGPDLQAQPGPENGAQNGSQSGVGGNSEPGKWFLDFFGRVDDFDHDEACSMLG